MSASRVCLCAHVRPHLHDLVLELWQEEVDDLVLLDWQGVEVDLLHALDLAGLHETTELGDWLPLLLVALRTTTARTSTTTSTASTVSTATVAARTETTANSAWSSTASVCHCDVLLGLVVVSRGVDVCPAERVEGSSFVKSSRRNWKVQVPSLWGRRPGVLPLAWSLAHLLFTSVKTRRRRVGQRPLSPRTHTPPRRHCTVSALAHCSHGVA